MEGQRVKHNDKFACRLRNNNHLWFRFTRYTNPSDLKVKRARYLHLCTRCLATDHKKKRRTNPKVNLSKQCRRNIIMCYVPDAMLKLMGGETRVRTQAHNRWRFTTSMAEGSGIHMKYVGFFFSKKSTFFFT